MWKPPTSFIRLLRRFGAAKRGLAAIEFAMILPMLVVMFLASFDGGRALAVYMKLRATTYALAAIANQYSTIQSSDMSSIVGATSAIMAPYSATPLVATISQIWVSSKSKPTVNWSYSLNGTALTSGTSVTLPMESCGLATASCCLRGDLHLYTAVRLLWRERNHAFGYNIYMAPRISQCVLYPLGERRRRRSG